MAARLSTVDRFLAVWILAAMAVGRGLGRLVPGLNDVLAKVAIGGVSTTRSCMPPPTAPRRWPRRTGGPRQRCAPYSTV